MDGVHGVVRLAVAESRDGWENLDVALAYVLEGTRSRIQSQEMGDGVEKAQGGRKYRNNPPRGVEVRKWYRCRKVFNG